MSNYYSNYNQYLGSQRCCNVRTTSTSGLRGPTGPSAIGPIGYTGPARNAANTGATGNLIFKNLPTSAVGLPSGAVWNNLGVLNIA